MLLSKKDVRRLGVFVFYDRDGIVDDYVLYLLKSLKEATEDIIVVSNCMLSGSEKAKFFSFTDKIKIRENIGLDAGAFKEVYDEYQEYFKTFDEIILMNDTFYGPFVPFKIICETMGEKDIDFWGLSASYDSPDGFGYLPDKIIHSHIQTFFIAFRSTVLNSEAFNTYWQNYNIKKMRSFNNVVTKHEIVFTHYLEQAGFTWEVYTNLEKYHSPNYEENFNTYAYASYDLIKNYRCPFIKRKNFVFDKKDVLYLSDGEDNKKSLDYIKKEKLYDTDLIWKNLIRLYKTEDLYYGLNLNYIVEEKKSTPENCVVVFLLEEEKYVEISIEFLKNTNIQNLFVLTNNKTIKEKLRKEGLSISTENDLDKGKYDYVGIVKDNSFIAQKISLAYENNFANIKANGLESQEYLNGIVDIFETNHQLGILLLPQSLHSDYFGNLAEEKYTISANPNCCFVKKEIMDWKKIWDVDFVQNTIDHAKKSEVIVGKIFNKKAIANILMNQEYILHETYKILGNCNGYLKHISGLLYINKHTKRIFPFWTNLKTRLYRYFMKIYHKFF